MISAIFATDLRGNFGKGGTLPWPPNPKDFAWFKQHTTGHIVVMGRATWDDPKMPKPLPNRINVVVTSSVIKMPDVVSVSIDRLETKLQQLEAEFPDKKIFIIGGVKLLEHTKHLIEEIYWTQHKLTIQNATVTINLNTFFKDFAVRYAEPSEGCTFQILKRK